MDDEVHDEAPEGVHAKPVARSMTVVDSRSSMTAGPAISCPMRSADRSNTGTRSIPDPAEAWTSRVALGGASVRAAGRAISSAGGGWLTCTRMLASSTGLSSSTLP